MTRLFYTINGMIYLDKAALVRMAQEIRLPADDLRAVLEWDAGRPVENLINIQ